MVISSDVTGTGGRGMRAACRRTVAWRWLVERRLIGPGGVERTNLTPSMKATLAIELAMTKGAADATVEARIRTEAGSSSRRMHTIQHPAPAPDEY
jgi:hypothetical protein